ncbi:MAG TPA: DNA polymerase III subunit gamma/tau [Ktedonobacterales bacterium]|nr:DNA polymerase III subunit gamma/tau [Ktedonobacterales bacterium]
MASQSLYRKWRSQSFSELVGQEGVARTLLNAVRDGRLAHAYLFCGPRGTGKTSVARLLAKAVNCQNPKNGEPCNECISCREITAGHSPDVIEIDAASNTGVDNIRDLRENVNLLGSGGHHKVYVIDECFSYGELVTLADGTKMPIGKLVESQWQGEVLSYNSETQQIEPKRIVRHMKKVPVAPTVKVTFDNNRRIICTINHKFYTPDGQVCAGHLQVGQFVYTNRERITRHQRAVIKGAALGDGHIAMTGSAMRARLSIRHGLAQKEYLDYKTQLLGDLVRSPARFEAGVGTYSKTGTYAVSTLSRPEIAQIHRDLYGTDARKRISREFLDQLDELALTLWYLDDGSLVTHKYRYIKVNGEISTYPATRSTFSVYGLTAEEASIICAWHQERWGIESRVTVTARGPVIWLTLAGTSRLHEIIAPYVHPSMDYKLLPAYRGQFQMPAEDEESSGLAVSVVKSIEQVAAPEFVYNIEVADNHNYFVRDILVANCHMLSVSAFNALLKTLEEPPPHVIFVLATTEAHKVLATIVSRCQRFDFRRIRVRDIVAHLLRVAQGEGLQLEPAAAELLARAAQGGMRDALSLLDQAITFCGNQIDVESTRRMLGLADPAALRTLIEAVADQRTAEGLERIHTLVSSGADLRQLTAQYAEEWRALMLARAGADVETIMDRTAEEAQATAALAERFSLEELAACARVFGRNEQPARGLPVPQLALELAFLECVGICSRNHADAQPQPRAPQGQPSPTIQPSQQTRQAPSRRHETPQAMPSNAMGAMGDSGDIGNMGDRVETSIAKQLMEHTEPPVPTAPATRPAPLAQEPRPPQASKAPRAAQAAGPQDPALLDTLHDIQRRWTMIKKVCKQKSSMVSGLLSDAQPVQLETGNPPSLVIAVKWPFHLEKLREPSKREAVEWALEQVLERPMRVRMVLGGEGGAGQPAMAPPAGPQRPPDANNPMSQPDASAPNNIVPFPTPQTTAAAHLTRSRDTQPPAVNLSATAPMPAQQPNQPQDVNALEREVRTDPVIQELMRMGGTELAEVRPLDDDERS